MKVLRMFLWLAFVTGVIYPLLITLIATTFMKDKAHGSFIVVNGKIVGSSLIGQQFTSERYFWTRPSACNYNPLPSMASNLGPISSQLKMQVEERKRKMMSAHDTMKEHEIPSELLYATASGLDPHITKRAAYFQIERVAQARNLSLSSKKQLEELIESMVEKRMGFFIAEPYVNVLLLNQALDTSVGHNG